MRTNFQALTQSLGGLTGGDKQTSADGLVVGEFHTIEINEAAEFLVLEGIDGDGNTVDMLSNIPDLEDGIIGAPDLHRGGYISQIRLTSGAIIRRSLVNTQRDYSRFPIDRTLLDASGFILEDSAGFTLESA